MMRNPGAKKAKIQKPPAPTPKARARKPAPMPTFKSPNKIDPGIAKKPRTPYTKDQGIARSLKKRNMR